MLSPADAALAARDPALPGLRVLLDDAALAGLLGGPVTRRYLRYKPGTSCVLAAVVDGRDVAVTVVADDGVGKLAKTVGQAPAGSVLLERPGLLVTTPRADRDLPGLRRLDHTLVRLGLPAGPVRRLSWKPARRFVGLLGHGPSGVVLRLHRVLPDLPAGLPGVRPVLAQHRRLAVRALPFVPGRPLDALLREGPSTGALHRAGEALAALHDAAVADLPRVEVDLAAAGAAVGVLLPDLADVAADLAAGLVPGTGDAVLHGDFSADQVVVDGPDVVLIDLDRVRRGAPADDLGCWRAAALLHGLPASAQTALHEGYAGVRPVPDADEIGLHAAAHLLRRAADPFRSGHADWEPQVRRLLAAAQAQLSVAA